MRPWTDSSWLEAARAWISAELARLRIEPAGPIEQPHLRPWSTVLRVPTADGDLWFKANLPVHAHEAAVVQILSRVRPDRAPELLGVDPDRGWMLMADAGVRLRELIARERHLRRWLDVLPAYGELQLDVAARADDLAALGTPVRRLASLAGAYERLLDDVRPAADAGLRRLVPRVAELCDELAAYGVPETIQHDDFHDGQVCVRRGRYRFFDWGDACVSHPFFTMSVTLEGVISWGVDDVEGSEDVTRYRDAYLEPFARFGNRDELTAAHAIALRLGWICRALNVHAFAHGYQPPHRDEHLRGVGLRLDLFAAGIR